MHLCQVVRVVVAGVESVEGELLQDEVDDAQRRDHDVLVGGGDGADGPRRPEQGFDEGLKLWGVIQLCRELSMTNLCLTKTL